MGGSSNSTGWQQLVDGVDLPFHRDLVVPTLREVRLAIPNPEPVADVVEAARSAVTSTLGAAVTPGMTVAVGGGSRGLTQRVDLLRGTILGLRDLGAGFLGGHCLSCDADGQQAREKKGYRFHDKLEK